MMMLFWIMAPKNKDIRAGNSYLVVHTSINLNAIVGGGANDHVSISDVGSQVVSIVEQDANGFHI